MILLTRYLFAIAGLSCVLPFSTSVAQTSETSRVLPAGGAAIGNATHGGVITIGQGVVPRFSSNGSYLNHGGFLHSFLKGPSASADTDDDGLSDWAEMRGDNFDPRASSSSKKADTDGDGHSDLEELASGTDPSDALSQLTILDVCIVDGDVVVTWLGREGYTYDSLASSSVAGLTTGSVWIASVTPFGGMGSWRETYPAVTNQPTAEPQSYKVILSK